MHDVYKNIVEYNLGRKCNILVDMIAVMISNKKINRIEPELFIRERKLIISTAFITQSYFSVPKDVSLNCTYILL